MCGGYHRQRLEKILIILAWSSSMADRFELKSSIRAMLEKHGRTSSLSEEDRGTLDQLVSALEAISPYVAGKSEDVVQGSWQTEFASFGIKHSMGKNQEHDSDLALQSFSRLPKVPVRVSNLIQEIDQATCAYNNVVTIMPPTGSEHAAMATNLIVHGRYRIDAEDLTKFHIDFYKVAVTVPEGRDETIVKTAFGLTPDQVLSAELAPPKLWSAITYVDEDMRINKGNFGGLYILSRRKEPTVSF
jgi:hypothetical protein